MADIKITNGADTHSFNQAAVASQKKADFIKNDSTLHGLLTDAQLGEVWDMCAEIKPAVPATPAAAPVVEEVKPEAEKKK